MADYNGYVTLPTGSYDAWKYAVNGNSYDADPMYGAGCQCWDLVSEFYYNIGFPMYYPTLAGTGSAYGAWNDREQNAGDAFQIIYNKESIKKGDIIIYNHFPANPYGHMGFADEDYNGSNNLNILSQNNGGNPDPSGGTDTNVANYDLQYFLGAFRYKAWHPSPPPSTREKHKFPFVLYASRLRLKRQGML